MTLAAEVLQAIGDVYDRCGPAGGCLHIVLDDENTEVDSVEWCLGRGCCPVCERCARLLLKLNDEDRARAVEAYHWAEGIHENPLIRETTT